MDPTKRERRGKGPADERKSFGELAKVALRTRIRDTRGQDVRWAVEANLAWASWPRDDGRHVYVSLRRRQGLITGELGNSLDAIALDELREVASPEQAAGGGRIDLGSLLHGHAKTWSSGGSEAALIERLDWVAQQLQLRLHAFVTATRPPSDPR